MATKSTKISPMKSTLSKQEQAQAKAMADLMARREAFSKKYGHWPSDEELSRSMGGKK
jgi:hypothetical protein